MFSVIILILSRDFHGCSYWTAVIVLDIRGCEFYVLQCWELAQTGKKWVRCSPITCERLSSELWVKRNFSKSIRSFSLKSCISVVILKRYLGIEDWLIFFPFTEAVMSSRLLLKCMPGFIAEPSLKVAYLQIIQPWKTCWEKPLVLLSLCLDSSSSLTWMSGKCQDKQKHLNWGDRPGLSKSAFLFGLFCALGRLCFICLDRSSALVNGLVAEIVIAQSSQEQALRRVDRGLTWKEGCAVLVRNQMLKAYIYVYIYLCIFIYIFIYSLPVVDLRKTLAIVTNSAFYFSNV